MAAMGADLAEVVRRERLLLDPAVRRAPDRVHELLHAEFVEHGASGRVWDRAAVAEALAASAEVSGEATDFVPVALSRDVVLLTYRILGPSGSLRSSVWVRDAGQWRLRFHQGTRSVADE
jgi:ribonuclease HI